jgi:hypothetical protein
MMTKIQAWKNIAIAVIFVGEPLLFSLKIPFSVPFLLLEQTWPIQAVIGFGLVLISMEMSSWSIVRRIITLVIAFPFLCLAGLFLWKIPFSFRPPFWSTQAALGFCLILIGPIIAGLELSTSPVTRRLIVFVIVLPLCVLTSLLSWGGGQLRNTAQLGEYHYYLTTRIAPSGPGCDFGCNLTVLALYKCNSFGLECESILHWEFEGILESNLVVDKDANELLLFLSGYNHPYGLFYVYGKQPRFIGRYSTEFGGNIYYLATQQEREPYTYMLLKCKQDSMGCKRLPFEYITANYDLWIDIDDTGKLIIDDEVLIYTYDTYHSQSVCHIEGCILKDQ